MRKQALPRLQSVFYNMTEKKVLLLSTGALSYID